MGYVKNYHSIFVQETYNLIVGCMHKYQGVARITHLYVPPLKDACE